jgi:serine/threonine-protein kinase
MSTDRTVVGPDREADLSVVLAEYLEAVDAGQAPDREALLARRPHLAEQLRAFFADQDRLDQLAAPLRGEAPQLPEGPGGASAASLTNEGEVLPLDHYAPLTQIDSGGMGIVYRGRDPHLGRELAVKVLLPRHQGRPEMVRRFIEEAQVTGQLQHPGVPPVYERGRLPDGRPFFTMKLIAGQTLAALLQARLLPDDALPQFVGIFAQVCQAVAYAHSRGVIHRDLKPSNVMVGAFGEVQVMDWGLAKVLRSEPAEGAQAGLGTDTACGVQTVRTVTEGHSSQAGTVFGTNGYMAPEQGRGEIDALDERADVFGLGAILCEILTGQPPYQARSLADLARLGGGELADAFERLERCGADRKLIDLARRCLGADPRERPRQAGEVADEVAAYQRSVEERLREAERARAMEQVKTAEERKRRRLAVGLTLAVLGLALFGGGGGLWLRQVRAEARWEQKQRNERAQEAVTAALEEVKRLAQQGRWEECRAVLAQAESRLGEEVAAELHDQIQEARDNLDMVARLDEARMVQASASSGKGDTVVNARAYAKAFAQYHLDLFAGPVEEVVARLRASPIRAQLVAALDDWAWQEKDLGRRWRLMEVARRTDPGEWKDRLRDPSKWMNRPALERLARQARVESLSPQLVSLLAALLERQGEGIRLLERGQRHWPADFWLNFSLANALRNTDPGRLEEAIGYYRAALAVRPRNAWAHHNLGSALAASGKSDAAIAHFHKAIECDPKLVLAHLNLARALRATGKVAQARASFLETTALDPSDADIHTEFGDLLLTHGQVEDCIAQYQKALAINPEQADAHHGLGQALYRQRKLAGAITYFNEAVRLDPENAVARTNLGVALADQGEREQAIGRYKEAIALDPKYANAHYNLGNALKRKGQVDEALASYCEATRLDPRHAHAHNAVGAILCDDKRDPDGALPCFRKALAIDPKLADAYRNIGIALIAKGEKYEKEAIGYFRQAIHHAPKLVPAHASLGISLARQGKMDEAISSFMKVIELDARHAQAHYNLSVALFRKEKWAQGLGYYEKAVALSSQYAGAHGNLSRELWERGQFGLAEASTRRVLKLLPAGHPHRPVVVRYLHETQRWLALEKKRPDVLTGKLQPAGAVECAEFAQLCAWARQYRASARLYKKAFALDRRLAEGPHLHQAAGSAARAGCGQGEGAEKMTDEERSGWRKQAHAWLRDELTALGKLVESGQAAESQVVRRELRFWRVDADLAGVRDRKALGKLPEAEQAQWRKLWGDVQALLAKLDKSK